MRLSLHKIRHATCNNKEFLIRFTLSICNKITGLQYKRINVNSVALNFVKTHNDRVFRWNSHGIQFRRSKSLLETSFFNLTPSFARLFKTNQLHKSRFTPKQNNCIFERFISSLPTIYIRILCYIICFKALCFTSRASIKPYVAFDTLYKCSSRLLLILLFNVIVWYI